MREADYSTQFDRDLRRLERRGKDIAKLKALALLLLKGQPLPASYRDHPLKGRWVSYRDAHIESDWILVYKVVGDIVRFERTGTHSDLFGE